MTDGTTRRYNEGKALSGVQRRRRWTPEEKVRIGEETYLPGLSVSLVAGRHGIGALLRRQAEKIGRTAPNPKRVCRVMKVHGLLLQRDGERREERRHDGRVVVDQRNTRLVFRRAGDRLRQRREGPRRPFDKLRTGFALDCCDREAMGYVATTGGITAEDVQDLMVATVEHRYGQ